MPIRAVIKPEHCGINFDAHRRIFDAVAAHDADEVEVAMQAHLI
jgi:DNA-binding FadR family transcriptional regulator